MKLTKQEQFFYDNAGYCYTPGAETKEQGHINSAKRLAAAETWANDNDITYDWQADEDHKINSE